MDAREPVDFGLQIRQVLSDKCFRCHGPDEGTRESGLRLDVRQDALDMGAIEPGDAASSELVARIESTDADLVMPPPEMGKPVTAEEKELLKRWISEGAVYEEHWAFVPPSRPDVPTIDVSDSHPDWHTHPIDAFVLQQLQKQGLKPSAPASADTLLRRLHLDLTGLPPAWRDVQEFDGTDEAYVASVENLLSSEHFGERWARWWLDAARYADSDGYEKDKPRRVWFYRDWVIRAMNEGMPYDEFIIQQIAGDLLPDAGQAERVATGFLRNSMVNEEGGADPEQFRVEGLFDRVDAVGKAILGITTQCAQCHSHKYDPMTQSDYYQVFASLNDCYEAMIPVFTPEQLQQRDEVASRIEEIEREFKERHKTWQQEFAGWQAAARSELVGWTRLVPTDIPYEGQKFRQLDDGSIVSESYAPTKVTNTFRLSATAPRVTAFRIDLLQHPQLPRGGPGRSMLGTAALTEFEVSVTPAGEKPQKLKFAYALADARADESRLPAMYRDRDPDKDMRVTGPIEYAIDGDMKTAWTTDIGPAERNRARHAIFVLEKPLEIDGEFEIALTIKQHHGGWNSDDNQNYIMGRYAFSMTGDEAPKRTVSSWAEKLLTDGSAERSEREARELLHVWLASNEDLGSWHQRLQNAKAAFPETDSQLVVQTMGQSRDSYVLTKGNFLDRAEQVEPGVPSFLGELDSGDNEPARLQLAQWLVRDDAPTTARVIVNRIWQAYFGQGLVTTPEDFGLQSAPPSHPHLLDWLAVELVESGWDLKHIHRLIVTSQTYRQSSNATPDMVRRDPRNVWLARGPRFRADAELVRDIALKVSGLLDETVGGPSVYPPSPDFLYEPPASYGPKIWDTDAGQHYRRSLYVHTYRSVPYPPLQVFDAPKGDAACIRRERSNTPLQALVLLNESQFIEFARAFASRIIREGPLEDVGRLRFALREAVGREPSADELAVLLELLKQQRQRISDGEVDVAAAMGVSPDLYRQLTGREAAEAYPWVIVARVILNLDETISKS